MSEFGRKKLTPKARENRRRQLERMGNYSEDDIIDILEYEEEKTEGNVITLKFDSETEGNA